MFSLDDSISRLLRVTSIADFIYSCPSNKSKQWKKSRICSNNNQSSYLSLLSVCSGGISGSTVLLIVSHSGHKNSFLLMSKLDICIRKYRWLRRVSFASSASKNLPKTNGFNISTEPQTQLLGHKHITVMLKVKVLRPTQHKIGNLRDICRRPSSCHCTEKTKPHTKKTNHIKTK